MDRISRAHLNDMEARFTRGRSEERYPHYYRGRSASPVREGRVRSWSAEREVLPYQEPSVSPPRHETAYRTSVSPLPHYELSKPYMSDFHYERPSTAPYYYMKPQSYYYYRPTSFYTQRQPMYSYYRPFTRYSSSGLRGLVALADINANRYWIPKRRPYTTLDVDYPLTSPLYRTSFTYRPINDYLYLPTKHRSYYDYPNLKYNRSILPSVSLKYPGLLYPSMYHRP